MAAWRRQCRELAAGRCRSADAVSGHAKAYRWCVSGWQPQLLETFLKELSDEAIDLMIERGNRAHSPLTTVEFYGGAPGRIGDADTAFAQRQAEYNVGILAQWTDASEKERHVGWAGGLNPDTRPVGSCSDSDTQDRSGERGWPHA
jgi:hypothetical protein